MSLLRNDILSPQVPRSYSTTRSKRDGNYCHDSQHSDPGLCHHTSDFCIPSKVKKPEVCRSNRNEMVPRSDVRCGVEIGQRSWEVLWQEDLGDRDG